MLSRPINLLGKSLKKIFLAAASILLVAACASGGKTSSAEDAKVARESFAFEHGLTEVLRTPYFGTRNHRFRVCLMGVEGFGESGPKKQSGFLHVSGYAKDKGYFNYQFFDLTASGGVNCTEFIGREFIVRLGRNATGVARTERAWGFVEAGYID